MTTTIEPRKATPTTPAASARTITRPTNNRFAAPAGTDPRITEWVTGIAAITKPARIAWCDGTAAEFDRLTKELVAQGTLIRLNPEYRPFSFLARSDPD